MDHTQLDRALTGDAQLRPMPEGVCVLLREVSAPPRLAAHLRAVHDVAWQLTAGIAELWPELPFDREKVLFGAATHDIGKAVHPSELSQPGTDHEQAGYELLIGRGVEPRLARFAANHGAWTAPNISIEDLLVSLADKIWKAKRVQDLEDRILSEICDISGESRWQAFSKLDDLLDRLAQGSDARLAFQNQYPVAVVGRRVAVTDRPLLFLDVDGTLLSYATAGLLVNGDANQMPADLDPQLGRRLAALPCDLVWATTWMAEANEVLAPRLGLPQLPVVDWPDDDNRDNRLHWKTRRLVQWAAGRPFVWADDEITDADRAWVAANHSKPALLHRVDPHHGLSDSDLDTIARWLNTVQ